MKTFLWLFLSCYLVACGSQPSNEGIVVTVEDNTPMMFTVAGLEEGASIIVSSDAGYIIEIIQNGIFYIPGTYFASLQQPQQGVCFITGFSIVCTNDGNVAPANQNFYSGAQ